MWQDQSELIADGRAVKISLFSDEHRLTYQTVIRLWQTDERFRSFFIALLDDAPFDVYRFETPPVSLANAGQPFEFVLIDSPSLHRPASRRAFRNQFETADADDVLTFPNFGGDATMVVPCPPGDDDDDDDDAYCHIAAFTRQAPEDRQDMFWQAVGDAMADRLSDSPVWLSTAGGGVPWLHMRLDDRPKYYAYRPYRQREPQNFKAGDGLA